MNKQPHDQIDLTIDGQKYGGWQRMSLMRGIEQIAGVFELRVTDRWPGQATSRPIRPGSKCQVTLGDEPVITGYVDEISLDYDAESHSLRVAGRDKTGELVDCSAIYKTGNWANVTLTQIARDLCRPFGISVKSEIDDSFVFPSFGIEPGEPVFECLDRAARLRAAILVSDATGNLVITTVGNMSSGASLMEGTNIKRGTARLSWQERHSVYTVLGQGKIDPDGELIDAHRAPSASVKDDIINRYRPLITLAESHQFAVSLKDRAQWECNTRRGRGCRATITVQGWRNESGALWTPNRIVHLTSPSLWIDAGLLIVDCTYTLDENQGTSTQLTLSLPEAFDREGVKVRRDSREKSDKYWGSM